MSKPYTGPPVLMTEKHNRKPREHAITPKNPLGGGRSTVWKDEYIPIATALAGIAEMSDAQIGVVLGITASTFKNWKRTKPEFSNAIANGRTLFEGQAVQILAEAALRYRDLDTIWKLLARRFPQKYGERARLDLGNADGETFKVEGEAIIITEIIGEQRAIISGTPETADTQDGILLADHE